MSDEKQRVITSGPISDGDLIPNTVIEVRGKWFCIHGFYDGQILYARGEQGELVGDVLGRMNPVEFVAGINDAFAAPPAAIVGEGQGETDAARKD